MNAHGLPSPHIQSLLDRFIAACRADERVAAALLVGSIVQGTADSHSDVDLILVTTEESYDGFAADCQTFARQLGEPLFLEDFDLPGILFLILPDGLEVDLGFMPESRVGQVLGEPHWSLLDKKGLLAGAPTAAEAPLAAGQKRLRRQLAWFWHDLSHFTTAIARGQLWWAAGQLEILRRSAITLARLRHDFADEDVDDDPSFKLDKALPAEELASLRETFVALERDALLGAARIIVRYFNEAGNDLATSHSVPYPSELEQLMLARLEQL